MGGGIAGVGIAYYLALSGVTSTVVERDSIGSHASGFAYGGLSGGIPNGPNINGVRAAAPAFHIAAFLVALKEFAKIS